MLSSGKGKLHQLYSEVPNLDIENTFRSFVNSDLVFEQ